MKTIFLAMLLSTVTFVSANSLERGTPGPLGFSDIRAAFLPPAGLYGAASLAYVRNRGLDDGNRNRVRFLDSLETTTQSAALTFLYVPDLDIFGGKVGARATFSVGRTCGRIFAGTNKRCFSGLRDPYVEFSWSRFMGTVRPSRHPGALPILEGLAVSLGLGVVVPIGKYDPELSISNGLSLGLNTWDIAPNIAFTYTTPPIFAEGTEFSAKLSFNEYLKNSITKYSTGDLVNVDFAVSERLGRLQLGVGGNYYRQIEDDEQFGVRVGIDGRRAEVLNLGVVGAYDMPEIGSSIRFKAVTTVINENFPNASSISISFIKKLN